MNMAAQVSKNIVGGHGNDSDQEGEEKKEEDDAE